MSQRSELIQTIQDIENGLAMNPTGEILERLTSRLARAKAKLDGLDEKKSVEPSANQGQLPTKTELQEWQKKAEKEIRQTHEEIANMQGNEKAEHLGKKLITQYANMVEREQRVIAKIENPKPITVPVVEMDFKDRYGNTYTRALDQADILSLLKTYFKRVAVSPKMEDKRFSEAYGSNMGKMVHKLFQGWNTIYNETQEGAAWPPLEDVFPGLGRASQSQKVNAEILWRWASNDK